MLTLISHTLGIRLFLSFLILVACFLASRFPVSNAVFVFADSAPAVVPVHIPNPPSVPPVAVHRLAYGFSAWPDGGGPEGLAALLLFPRESKRRSGGVVVPRLRLRRLVEA